jgi:hypothetical protein
MNLEIDGTSKIILVEESQGLTLNTESQKIAVGIGGISVKGPQGERGEKGDTGDVGIAVAESPILYNTATKTISADTGTGDLQLVLGSDIRLSNTRTPSDASVTDVKINGTLNQSKITNLTSDLSTLTTNVNGKAPLVHTHVITDITNLSSTLTGKQNTSEKNQANGYVGLNSSTKIDSQYLPVQNPTQYASVSGDSAFNIAAVSPYGSINWVIGDKIIKTGGTNPGTYVKFQTTYNDYRDWFQEAASGISQIVTSPGGNKTGSSVNIGYSDIGAAPTSHTHTLNQITDAGNSASKNTGTTSGTVAAGDDSRIVGAAQKSSNLGDLTSVSTARSNLGLGDSATKNVGTTSSQVAAGAHPHVFRTSHNFIIQGNIVTSSALAIPPFFAIHGWPAAPTGSSGITQGDTSMTLVEVHHATTSGTVNFQIYKITDNNPINTSSNTVVLLPAGGITLGDNSDPSTRVTASSTAAHLDNNNFTPVSITDRNRIGIYITGIGGTPQNLTVTLVFEHRLN